MKKLLISAGPTREKIDAVRFISNRSSGKMGYAIAAAARDCGFAVTLISGPVTLTPPDGVTCVKVESAAEMAAAVKKFAGDADVIIMAAAVADYRPKNVVAGKMKKTSGDLTLELERTEDILLSLGMAKKNGQLLVGFAAETADLLANAAGKLQRKNLDWIVANDVGRAGQGMGSDCNSVTMLARDGRRVEIPLAAKNIVAEEIMRVICHEQ